MSCVVGLVENDIVYMGADCCAYGDDEVRIRKDTKIFHNGDLLIGFAGNIRTGQYLKQEFLSIPKDIHMISHIVDYIRDYLIDKNMTTTKDEIPCMDCSLIIAYNKKLYEVLNDFQLCDNADGYTAVGSGKYFALSSLYSTKHLNPEERVLKALETAQHFCPFVRGPFIMETTR